MPSHHVHPNPALNRLTHYGALLLIALMVIVAVAQFALALVGFPVAVLVITSVITLLLIAPVILLTTATPAVTVTDEGITIEPVIWRSRFVRWDEIAAVKPYPLLPPRDSELGRQALTGRRRYRPAEGIMLVIPSLPFQYCFTGVFTGEGFTGIIAFTNRTHTDYSRLVSLVKAYCGSTDDESQTAL